MKLGKSITKRMRALKGFTLAEVLIVIVIIGILSGIAGVSAVSIYRNIKQTQLDKTAETIFHAAQDRLSELYAYGKEDQVADGLPVDTVDASKKVMYISSEASGSTAYGSIMGDDTVSGDIFSNLWAIEYQASTCRVLNVVYADKSDSGLGGFGRGINAVTALDSMVADLKSHSFNDRKNKYGWYGDEGLTDLQEAEKQIGNTSVNVEIINEENLYAHINASVGWEDDLDKNQIAKFLEKVVVKITLKEADSSFEAAPSKTFEISGKELLSKGTIESDAEGYYNAKSDGDDVDAKYVGNRYLSASWDMLLDSLEADAFTGSNTIKTINGYGTGITPGSNFYLIVSLESKNDDDDEEAVTVQVPTVQDYDVDNSLFAGYSATDQIAYIEYGRHLQNIGKGQISGFHAVQISDIDFNLATSLTRDADLDGFNKYWLSVYPDTNDGFTLFSPLSSSYLESYDGQDHVIKNLDINTITADGNFSGIFGDLSKIEDIKKVIISDSTISTPAAEKAGMFAGSLSGSSPITIENCYLNGVTLNASSGAAVGGFAGEITSDATVKECAFVAVNTGTSTLPTDSGAFAGKVSGAFQGTDVYALGGRILAFSNAGGIIGNSTDPSSDVRFSKGKAIGTIVSASSGNAGGLIGSADSILSFSDSAYFMPSSAESSETVCKVTSGFLKAIGIPSPSDEALLTYSILKSNTGFRYVDDLKTHDIAGMMWISGGANAGGLVGSSTKNISIQNTFATGVLSGYSNAGGFVGSTDGILSASNSYTDFYISGANVGGFAANCALASNFDSCYSAGFLVGSAENAAGFAPVDVGDIANSYTVFNFDNVFDSSLFAGSVQEDDEHKLNVNGLITNYPDVAIHNYYPIAKSSSGKAYYVYPATKFDDTDSAVCVSAPELAANTNEDGEALLTGNFAVGEGRNNTVPYSLSSFFGSSLRDYPFPIIKVDETVLKHYNDWLILDKNTMYNLEIWYMMYNEDMTSLKTDVASVGRTGFKFVKKTRVVAVSNEDNTEYQINVGSRQIFSGYKFVGYFDPVTASKPLVDGTAIFDRTQKFDYVKSDDPALLQSIKKAMRSGDVILQTSINGKNTYNYNCADHSSILEESDTNTYAGTKRIYAVYRYNRPYNVTLSYVEYELPSANATTESQSLEQIYNGSKIASNDVFEVIYTEPDRASHPELASDEELTEDYIAEKVLFDQYKVDGDETKYKNALSDLAAKRATVNQVITRRVPDYSRVGFDLFNIDNLRQNSMITAEYAQFIRNMPVYTIVRISPDTRDPDGNTLTYKDRCTEIEESNDSRISMNTDKAYHYVIMYNSNKARKVLNLVFKNTESDEDGVVPIFNSYDNLSDTLSEKEYISDNSKNYTVRVSNAGFQDKYISLEELMKVGSHPTFDGFTLNEAESSYVHPDDGSDVVTLYYDRTKYVLSFKLNSPLMDPPEKYYDSTSRNEIQDIAYGQAFQGYLWEVKESDIEVDIQGYYLEALKSAYQIQIGEIRYWRWTYYNIANNYKELENYVRQLPGTSGSFRLQFYFVSGGESYVYTNDYSWSKTDGAFGYAFNRSGYFLSGFNYYYQDDNGELSYNGKRYTYIGETTGVTTILNMPDKNVLVEPEWTVNPKNLRVEIYYQSAYDDVSSDNEAKEYEFYRSRTCDVSNGIATTQSRRRLPISALVASVNTGLVNFLEPYFAAGDFYKKDEHNLTGSGFNPYVSNEENSVRFGYPHDGGNDTMVVALYYDRAAVEYRFHFINASTYSVGNYPRYYIRNQWADFVANSALYNYTGDLDDHIALRDELHNPSGDYVAVGKHAKVKVKDENQYAVSGTDIDYGGFNGNYYGVLTASNNNTIVYSKTIYYQALYGAPAVFSSDDTSLIPYWYCYMGGATPVELQRYIIGGSTATGSSTYYNDYSLKYFGDVSTATASLSKDMYPYYPPVGSGSTVFYTEVAPSDDSSFPNVRTSASQSVNQNMFKQNPTISTFGKATNGQLVFWTNGGMRIFLDGYTTYAYRLEGQSNFSTDIPELAGSGVQNIYILLQRNTYTMSFVDASLKNGVNFDTSYLYKQVIPRLPREDEINSPGSDYIFDGWYTSSAYTTRIADANGNIDEDYKRLSSTMTDSNGNLLMNYENIKVFAKWAPRECRITFNPFYPDATSYGVDDRLTINPNPVLYGSTIDSFPEILKPEGSAYTNRVILHEDGETYYAVTNNIGEAILKYKFLGWYKYTGLNTPSDMTDLQVQFVEGSSQVTDHTVLYAKWEQVLGKALYTIVCLDYTHEGEEIFIVERSGVAGENLTVTPPSYDNPNDKDVQIIKGSYDDLKDYEVISTAITKTLINGMTFKFRYKESSDWKYVVRNCITTDDGTDIVISKTESQTSYNQVMIAAPDIEGYSIYQYQIGNEEAKAKTDTSGYIPVLKPEDESGTLTVTIRYRVNENILNIRSDAIDYYRYDPLDWVIVPERVFNWEDDYYLPAIYYCFGEEMSTYELIGNVDDSTISDDAIEKISGKDQGTYENVSMTLVAMNKADKTIYKEIQSIGSTTVRIIKSAYSLTFTDATDPQIKASIYYAFGGSKLGAWFWDKELKYKIGENNTSIVSADRTNLPDTVSEDATEISVSENAARIIHFIDPTEDDENDKYNSFYIIVPTEQPEGAYTVVDENGLLGNGDKLSGDMDAHLFEDNSEDDNTEDGTTEDVPIEITLFDVYGNETTITITIKIPKPSEP